MMLVLAACVIPVPALNWIAPPAPAWPGPVQQPPGSESVPLSPPAPPSALTVSSANPRVSRSGNLLLALCAFVVYYNLLNLGQSWINLGRYSMGGFMLALHGGALALALLWLAKRHFNWGWRLSGLRSRSSTGARA